MQPAVEVVVTSRNRSLTSSIAAEPSTEKPSGCLAREGFAVLGDGEVDRVLSSSAGGADQVIEYCLAARGARAAAGDAGDRVSVFRIP